MLKVKMSPEDLEVLITTPDATLDEILRLTQRYDILAVEHDVFFEGVRVQNTDVPRMLVCIKLLDTIRRHADAVRRTRAGA